jgi:hypothetical protein
MNTMLIIPSDNSLNSVCETHRPTANHGTLRDGIPALFSSITWEYWRRLKATSSFLRHAASLLCGPMDGNGHPSCYFSPGSLDPFSVCDLFIAETNKAPTSPMHRRRKFPTIAERLTTLRVDE